MDSVYLQYVVFQNSDFITDSFGTIRPPSGSSVFEDPGGGSSFSRLQTSRSPKECLYLKGMQITAGERYVLLLSIILPPLAFLLRGKILTAIICLILLLTLIGWPIAAIWAVVDWYSDRADRRNKDLIRAMDRTR